MENIKFLHIITPEGYCISKFIRMTLWDFERKDHKMICNRLVSAPSDEVLLYSNVDPWGSLPKKRLQKSRELKKLIDGVDVVVFHSFVPTWSFLVFLWTHPSILKKSVLDMWERDVVVQKVWIKGKHRELLRKIFNRMAADCRKKFGAYIVQSEPYIDWAKECWKYDFEGKKVCVAPYEFYDGMLELADEWKGRKNNTSTTRIWVSDYISPKAQIFRTLGRYAAEDVHIYTVADQRETDDANLDQTTYPFIDRTYQFEKQLPEQRMIKLISALDIGIFDQYKRMNTFQMLMFLYMGKKVFLHKTNPWYRYLKGLGLAVYAIEDIEGMSFEEFSAPASDVNAADAWIKKYYSHENAVEAWKQTFATLSEVVAGGK